MTKLKVKFFTRKHIALLLYKYFTCEKIATNYTDQYLIHLKEQSMYLT